MKLVCRLIVAAAISVSGTHSAGAQSPTLYRQPFPGHINSTYGPRVTELKDNGTVFAFKPGFHPGLDFLQSATTPITATAKGTVESIDTDANAAGIRMWIRTSEGKKLGYFHLFSNAHRDENFSAPSGFFVLLKRHPYVDSRRITLGGLRISLFVEECNTILNTKSAIALVPSSCVFAEGQKLPLLSGSPTKLFTITNKVEVGQEIAPVGTSGKPTQPVGAHLHLQWGKMGYTKHPLGTLEPIENADRFCTQLGDVSTIPPFPYATRPLYEGQVSCAFSQAAISLDLVTRPYLDVRVDQTKRLDLVGAELRVSGSPVQKFSVHFGPPKVNGNTVKSLGDFVGAVVRSQNCSLGQVPSQGHLLICPNDWKGQDTSSSRLERVFRLGIDSAAVAKGCNSVDVRLLKAAGGDEQFKLNFLNGESKPRAVNDVAVTKLNTPVTISVKNNDTNSDNEPLPDATVSDLSVDPSKGTVTTTADGRVVFVPNAGVLGQAVIGYRLMTPCGEKSNVASVTVNVTEDVDLNDVQFEFMDAKYSAGPTCQRFVNTARFGRFYADFEACRQYLEPVVRCVGKGCVSNRFAISTVGYSTTYRGQAFLVPGYTQGPYPAVTGAGTCSPYQEAYSKPPRAETYTPAAGMGWYPVHTSYSPYYPSGTYNSYLSGFDFLYFRNISNLVFAPLYYLTSEPERVCVSTGYSFRIDMQIYDRFFDTYRSLSSGLALP